VLAAVTVRWPTFPFARGGARVCWVRPAYVRRWWMYRRRRECSRQRGCGAFAMWHSNGLTAMLVPGVETAAGTGGTGDRGTLCDVPPSTRIPLPSCPFEILPLPRCCKGSLDLHVMVGQESRYDGNKISCASHPLCLLTWGRRGAPCIVHTKVPGQWLSDACQALPHQHRLGDVGKL
jgi:hypothetical protein